MVDLRPYACRKKDTGCRIGVTFSSVKTIWQRPGRPLCISCPLLSQRPSIVGDTTAGSDGERWGFAGSNTTDTMFKASKGALAREMRLQATRDRQQQSLLAGAEERALLWDTIDQLRMRIHVLEAALKEAKEDHADGTLKGAIKIDVITRDRSETAVRCLTGVGSYESLEALCGFLDADGAAQNIKTSCVLHCTTSEMAAG